MLREVICWGLFSSTLTRLIPHNLNTSLEMYLIRTSHVLIDLPEQVTVWCSGGCEEDVALMEDRCPAVLDHQLWDLQLQSRFRGSGLYLMSDWSSSLVLLFILLVYEDLRDELFIQICSGWFLLVGPCLLQIFSGEERKYFLQNNLSFCNSINCLTAATVLLVTCKPRRVGHCMCVTWI